jgi:hypothetical protein
MKLFFQVAVVLLGMTAVSLFAQEQAAKPTFNEGDTWRFNIVETGFQASSTEMLQGNYEVTYSQGKIKAAAVSGDKKEEVATGQDRPAETLLGLVASSEIFQNLKFPLSAGQKWKYSYRWKAQGAKNPSTRNVEIEVAGIEQVATPAGTFKAFKLQQNAFWPRPQLGQFTSTTIYFYSPETKSVVKSSYSDVEGQKREIELVKFGPGK